MLPRLFSPTLLRACRRNYSTTGSNIVPLVYDLHEPAKASSNAPRAIIFMHGLFGSKKNNRSCFRALARDLGRPVYAVRVWQCIETGQDLRNHGDSPHHPQHDYMAMASDVAGFIDEHKLTGPTLIGHSMNRIYGARIRLMGTRGAKTAMALALKSPELVEDIVSVDNAPIDAALLSNFGKYIQGMKKIEEAGVTRQAEADDILKDYEKRTEDKTQKFKVPLKILASTLDNLGDFPFKDPDSVRFNKPALFVRGTKSHYVPDEALPIIGKFFPRFELADIDAGHWVISEQPEAFRQGSSRPPSTPLQQLRSLNHLLHHAPKQPLHPLPRLTTTLPKARQPPHPTKLLPLLRAHHPLPLDIDLRADEPKHTPIHTIILSLVDPAAHAIERLPVRHIVDQDHGVRPAVVAVAEGAEALLSRGVEEVEPVGGVVDGEGFELVGGFRVELVVAVAYQYYKMRIAH
ncbi:hypothetical protein CJF30_00003271 [Rutstroemia sp. NJR-2017a BBW]|nr:hypothetical protein CJF30_00003271 [Rutstroemia sp. NJR-2017a BBW]